jgi:NADH:ubiquinone oxidoreductase subunit 2 (subunit N)
LESQNFCFLVLCGLLPDLPVTSGFSIEASINYLLLSAFSSGVLLFWTSQIYLQTGMTSLTFLLPACLLLILLAFMFKLGAAPMHMRFADIYQSISKPLLMYLATAPKLSLFGFWVRRSSMCGTAAWRSSPRGAWPSVALVPTRNRLCVNCSRSVR